MKTKRILTVQDISCVGQCSVTVALPIISACGIETCILPSAILSTHTGGFTGWTFRDLEEDMPLILKHWMSEGIDFDAVYTGYLGGLKQVDHVIDIMDSVKKPEGPVIVDPVMADRGELYSGYEMDYVEKIKELCARADFILPNLSEACFLTGTEFRAEYDKAYVKRILDKLDEQFEGSVIITGVEFETGEKGVVLSHEGQRYSIKHEKVSGEFSGAGDTFASTFVGMLIRGKPVLDAVKAAADFALICVLNTVGDGSHTYGLLYEEKIPELIKMF